MLIWDALTGSILASHENTGGAIDDVAFASSGTTVAWAADGKAWTWAWGSTPPRSLDRSGGAVRSVAFAPGDLWLAAGGDDGAIALWDPRPWDRDPHPRSPQASADSSLLGHRSWVSTIAFTAAGDLLASGGEDRRLVIWDMASREARRTIDATEAAALAPGPRFPGLGTDELIADTAGATLTSIAFDRSRSSARVGR